MPLAKAFSDCLGLPEELITSETLQRGGWAPENSIESMTSGFRMLGLSQMKRIVLVTLIKRWMFNSTRAGVLETLSVGPLPPLGVWLSPGRGGWLWKDVRPVPRSGG